MIGGSPDCRRKKWRRTADRKRDATKRWKRSMPSWISCLRHTLDGLAMASRRLRRKPLCQKRQFRRRRILVCFAVVSFLVASLQAAEKIVPLQEVLRDKDGN